MASATAAQIGTASYVAANPARSSTLMVGGEAELAEVSTGQPNASGGAANEHVRVGAGLAGQFGDALCYRARCAQQHLRPAVSATGQAADEHRLVVAYPYVIGMGAGARAFAVPLHPRGRAAHGFQEFPDSRVAGELAERVSCNRCGAFRPLGRHRRGGLPGRGELPYGALSVAAHHLIVSPGRYRDQHDSGSGGRGRMAAAARSPRAQL